MARSAGGERKERVREEKGQSLAEYAMILLFMTVACVAAVSLLGTPILGFYNGFNGSF